jgi:hypothetical protein
MLEGQAAVGREIPDAQRSQTTVSMAGLTTKKNVPLATPGCHELMALLSVAAFSFKVIRHLPLIPVGSQTLTVVVECNVTDGVAIASAPRQRMIIEQLCSELRSRTLSKLMQDATKKT